MNGHKVKRGMRVVIEKPMSRVEAGEWTVLDRAPEVGTWWLHRWNGPDYQAYWIHACRIELAE